MPSLRRNRLEFDLTQNRRTVFLNVLRGAGIGLANVIPGVSGGTVAAVTGIYDRLVYCFGNFFAAGWRRTLPYLAPIVLGTVGGFMAFAGIVDAALETYEEQTLFLFMGLIAGSVPYLVRRAGSSEFRVRYLVVLLVAFALVAWMGTADRPPTGNPITDLSGAAFFAVLGGGAVGSVAMVVPGLSGSFLLLVVGLYSTMTNAVRTLNVPVILVFFFGMFTGIVLASKIISWLLRSFPASSYYTIVGLVLGSLAGVWPGWSGGLGGALSVAFSLLGLALSLLLGTDFKERIRSSREYEIEGEVHG